MRRAYAACHQAVSDELHRQQPSIADGNQNGRGQQATDNGNTPIRNGQQPSNRKATASQVRAIHAIAQRLNLDLVPWLYEKFGLRATAELSLGEASTAIDELNALPAHS